MCIQSYKWHYHQCSEVDLISGPLNMLFLSSIPLLPVWSNTHTSTVSGWRVVTWPLPHLKACTTGGATLSPWWPGRPASISVAEDTWTSINYPCSCIFFHQSPWVFNWILFNQTSTHRGNLNGFTFCLDWEMQTWKEHCLTGKLLFNLLKCSGPRQKSLWFNCCFLL